MGRAASRSYPGRMRNLTIAAAVLIAAAAAAAESPKEKTRASQAGEAPPYDPSKPSPRPGFEAPAQTIPETVKTPPPNEGTSKPPAKTDAEIARALEKSLMDDPSAPRVENLSISVADGKVVVRGKVATRADKDRVSAKAGAAAGLRNVANELEVRSP